MCRMEIDMPVLPSAWRTMCQLLAKMVDDGDASWTFNVVSMAESKSESFSHAALSVSYSQQGFQIAT